MDDLTDREPLLGGDRRITGPGVDYRDAKQALVDGDREEAIRLLRIAVGQDPFHNEATDLLRMLERAEADSEDDFRDTVLGCGFMIGMVALVGAMTWWLRSQAVPIGWAILIGLVGSLIPALAIIFLLAMLWVTIEGVRDGTEHRGMLWFLTPVILALSGGIIYLTRLGLLYVISRFTG